LGIQTINSGEPRFFGRVWGAILGLMRLEFLSVRMGLRPRVAFAAHGGDGCVNSLQIRLTSVDARVLRGWFLGGILCLMQLNFLSPTVEMPIRCGR